MDDFECPFDGIDHSCEDILRWTEEDEIACSKRIPYNEDSQWTVEVPKFHNTDLYSQDSGVVCHQNVLNAEGIRNQQEHNKLVNMKLWIRQENSQDMSHLVPNCPKFSLGLLAALACINSAIGAVTETEVISFILHHFPYYRFACSSWRDALREAMKTEWRFGHNKTVTGIDSVYLWNPGNLEYDEENMEEINKDARGKTKFFEMLIKGEIGLPRQLFYDVIGLPAPEFAGPENSAMFYHLLSIGQYPKPFSHFIRIYTTPSIYSEPKFNGDFCTKSEANRRIDLVKVVIPWFGTNRTDGSRYMLKKYKNITVLHDYMWLYFMQQKFLRGIDIRHWHVPPVKVIPFTA